MSDQTIYTIGHSTRRIPNFMDILFFYGINAVVDVRSIPYSRYASQYNKENISKILTKNGIEYIFLGFELGAKDLNPNMEFNEIVSLNKFRNGLSKVVSLIEKHYKVCLMCSEYNPIECHRGILIGKVLYDMGLQVIHILEKDNVISQKDIENFLYSNKLKELLKKHHKGSKTLTKHDATLESFIKL